MKLPSALFLAFAVVSSMARAQEDSSVAELPAAEARLIMENPAAARRWSVSLISENMANAKALDEWGAQAPVRSVNGIGLIYKASDSTTFELRPRMEYASNHERLTGRARLAHDGAIEMADLMLRAIHGSKVVLGGSKPVVFDLQYYAPTDRVAQLQKENGLFRLDTSTEWMLSPRWSVGGLVSSRVLLNSSENPKTARGADAEYYRVMLIPSLNYAFRDGLSGYYAYYADVASTDAQRGIWRADAINGAYHEVGASWTVGSVLLNPYMISSVSHADASGSLFTAESRVFAFDTIDWGLTIIAKF
ncbi:MAG: hypothetical protein KF802_03625 [Bdellovibrionaceae bacterium]|nr:hypothetical protein [Pseudobdellovibrionaceae bacterium]MBX3033288.1 hypothetical protein [Pseudobdellovibrionaceae bacterium]